MTLFDIVKVLEHAKPFQWPNLFLLHAKMYSHCSEYRKKCSRHLKQVRPEVIRRTEHS